MARNPNETIDQEMYKGFSLVSGGLIYDLMARFKVFNKKNSQLRQAIFFALLTWLPLLILASLDGTLGGEKIEINFWEDFSIHIRFLFVVPFLILIGNKIDNVFIGYVKTTDRMIRDDQQDAFDRLIGTLNRMSNSYIPEILILVLVYLAILLKWDDLTLFDSSREFLARPDSNKLSPAGWYYFLFSFPFYLLLVFRWIWRWLIWLFSLFRFSLFKFQIEALHADNMAGLEYLNLVPLAFSFLFIALSAALAANMGMAIAYDGMSLNQYFIEILIYCIAIPFLLYAPLLIFMPMIMRALTRGIYDFGDLITRHNNDFAEKWLKGSSPKDDKLLGSMDNSSLNDINGSYLNVQGTKILPVNYKMILSSITLIVLPFIPLLFTLYSGSDMLKKLIEALFGS